MIGIMGDAEIDEGNVHEALLEYWKHGLENCWWIIDYNRQSLDSVVSDRLFMKMASAVREPRLEGRAASSTASCCSGPSPSPAASASSSGSTTAPTCSTRRWCSRAARPGGGSWRTTSPSIPTRWRIVRRHDDAALARLMTNLGGHDLQAILEAFDERADRPAGLLHRLHHQGLRPAVPGPQGQPFRADDQGADGRAARARGHQPGRGMGQVRRARRCRPPRSRHFSRGCRSWPRARGG